MTFISKYIALLPILLVVFVFIIVICSVISDAKKHKVVSSKVTEILDCTQATSDAWSGRKEGTCAVKTEKGDITTVKRPVYVGKVIEYLIKV